MCDSIRRWDRVMDSESEDETSGLLPGRDSATNEREVEDFKTVCTRVVYATTMLTAVLVVLTTTMYVIYFQPQAPVVEFQGVEFSEFSVFPMMDRTGVPTQGLRAHASVQVNFFNPSILYETNVREVTASVSFGRPIAHGMGGNFVVPKQWAHVIHLELDSAVAGVGGLTVPLYGTAPLLLEQLNEKGIVELWLEFQLKSEYSMFYGLVRTEYNAIIQCDIGLIPSTPEHHAVVVVNKISSTVH